MSGDIIQISPHCMVIGLCICNVFIDRGRLLFRLMGCRAGCGEWPLYGHGASGNLSQL
jgi:hypothetical protein